MLNMKGSNMSKRLEDRNKRLVLLRYNDPDTYTYPKLALLEGVSKQSVHYTIKRDWTKYLTKKQVKNRATP